MYFFVFFCIFFLLQKLVGREIYLKNRFLIVPSKAISTINTACKDSYLGIFLNRTSYV